jgi:hypothetical protein
MTNVVIGGNGQAKASEACPYCGATVPLMLGPGDFGPEHAAKVVEALRTSTLYGCDVCGKNWAVVRKKGTTPFYQGAKGNRHERRAALARARRGKLRA